MHRTPSPRVRPVLLAGFSSPRDPHMNRNPNNNNSNNNSTPRASPSNYTHRLSVSDDESDLLRVEDDVARGGDMSPATRFAFEYGQGHGEGEGGELESYEVMMEAGEESPVSSAPRFGSGALDGFDLDADVVGSRRVTAGGGGGGGGGGGAAAGHAGGTGEEGEMQGNTPVLIFFFILAAVLLVVTFSNFPPLTDEERAKLRFSVDVETVRGLLEVLQSYRESYYWTVLSGFCLMYLFLQTFSIPGAIILSILAGPIFGVWTGLFIVSVAATSGSAMCYLMSYFLGRGLVQRYLPGRLAAFRLKIQEHRHNLFYYMLFLRISPLLPNWFVNVSSPILNVPLQTFALATLIGLVPANYIHVTTGMTLSELTSLHEINLWRILLLFGLAFLALIPTLFRGKFEKLEGRMGKKRT